MKLLTCTLLVTALLPIPSLASAVEVSYSGNLLDSGTPVNGNRYVALNIYATSTGGVALQPVQAESLAVVGGVYHTALSVPDAIWFGGERWIGASINGGPEFVPRLKYYAAPRPTSQIFPALPNDRTMTSTQWTKADSVIVTVTNSGFAVVSILGYVQPTGSATTTLQLDLNPTTPTGFQYLLQPGRPG